MFIWFQSSTELTEKEVYRGETVEWVETIYMFGYNERIQNVWDENNINIKKRVAKI